MSDVYVSLCICLQSSPGSLSTLVRAVLSDKKPEDVPKVSFRLVHLAALLYIKLFLFLMITLNRLALCLDVSA